MTYPRAVVLAAAMLSIAILAHRVLDGRPALAAPSAAAPGAYQGVPGSIVGGSVTIWLVDTTNGKVSNCRLQSSGVPACSQWSEEPGR